MSSMSERILECIKKSGLTKTAFGKRIGVSQSFVSQMCSGVSVPSKSTIKNICHEFSISEEWLLTGEGEMFLPRTKEDELRDAIERTMPNEPTDFKRRLVVALSSLKEEHWALLEEKLREIVGDREPAPAHADDGIEQEADTAAAFVHDQVIMEKKAEGVSSASPSDTGGNTETA